MFERTRALFSRQATTPADPPAARDRLSDALFKRRIERILRDERMPRSAAERATRRIFEVLNDEQR